MATQVQVTALPVGGNTVANSTPVTLASDQAAISTADSRLPSTLGQKTSANSLAVVIASDNTVSVASSPSATVGTTTFHHLISAATTNATSVKATAGNVGVISVGNNATSKRFFKLYNKASAPTVGTDTPIMTVMLPPGETISVPVGPYGLALNAGIAYAIVQNIAVSDATAVAVNDVCVHIAYV